MININTGFHIGASVVIDDRAYLTKEQMLAIDENIYPDYFLTVCADDGFLYMFDKSIEEPSETTGKFKLFAGDVNDLLDLLTADVDTEGSILNLIRENGVNATFTTKEVDVLDEDGQPTGEKKTVADETIKAALERLANDLTYVGTVEELPEEPAVGDLVNVVPAEDAEATAPKGWKFWDGENWQSLDDPTLTKRVEALEATHDTKTEEVEGVEVTSFKTVEEEIIEKAKDGVYKEAVTEVNYSNEDGDVITEEEYNQKVEDGEDVSEWTKNEVESGALTIAEGIDAVKKDSVVTLFPIDDVDEEGVLKTYEFYQGLDDVTVPEEAKLIGKINIPKDLVVTSGAVIEIKNNEVPNPDYVDAETTPDEPEFVAGDDFVIGDDAYSADDAADEESDFYGYPTEKGTFIKLVVANQKLPIFINAKALIDTGSLGSTTEDVKANVEVGGVMVDDVIEAGTDIQELVERLLIKYYPPTVTLTSTPTNKVVELGEKINVELTASVTKKSLDIESVVFSDGTEAEDVAEGGSFSHEIADEIEDTTTFNVTVSDGKKDVKAEVTYTFVNPYWKGVVAADATDVDITTLDKLIEIKAKKKVSYTAANEYIVFAYPASYGVLTSIMDPNNFENLASFDKTSVTVNEVAYNVYTSATPVTCSNFAYTFIY